MIKGKQQEQRIYIDKPTVNYRKIDALNQSMLKLFDDNPVQFFQEFKMGKKRKDKKNTSLIIGDLVDFYLLQCKDESEFHSRFDERFALFNGVKGSGQAFMLADYLYDITDGATEDGKITTSFETRFKEALQKVQADDKYKGKTFEQALEDFEKKGGLEYFETRMENIGKVVVDQSIIDKALIVGNIIKNDDFTRHLFEEDDDVEIFTHFPIEWIYQVGEGRIKCKSEVDMIRIDHIKKVIYPIDLKTTYDNESFDYMYIKNGYYLQNAFYKMAIQYWIDNTEELKGYRLENMSFLVGDTSSNNRRPLIYSTFDKDYISGKMGFSLRGNFYRGVSQLIDEIVWCEENDIWDCSKESYDKKGQMTLSVKYD